MNVRVEPVRQMVPDGGRPTITHGQQTAQKVDSKV
jgi:hypothetical protein